MYEFLWIVIGVLLAVAGIVLAVSLITPPKHDPKDTHEPGLKVGPGGRFLDRYM